MFGAMTTTTHVGSFVVKQIISIGKISAKFIFFICRKDFTHSESTQIFLCSPDPELSYLRHKLEHQRIK